MGLNRDGAFGSSKAIAAGVLALLATLTAGGCVETAGDVTPGVEGGQQFARRPDASMAGATMAIVSIEGAPPEL